MRLFKGLKLLDHFPPPALLTMPAVGIDVSDFSVKFIELVRGADGIRIGRFGEEKIPDGVVSSGKIVNAEELTEILSTLRRKHKLHFIRASLPEEQGYLFEVDLPDIDDEEIESSIMFKLDENVPLRPEEAVFGYNIVSSSGKSKKRRRSVAVSVFPKAAAGIYSDLFHSAGLVPLSFEIEPQVIARSVIPRGETKTQMIVDFGRQRSGFSIAHNGIVRFASTVDVGGDAITRIFMKEFKDLSPTKIDKLKNEKGLSVIKEKEGNKKVMEVVDKLTAEISRYITYWNTHSESVIKNKLEVSKIILCGGNANLAGLPEYLSKNLKLSVERANVWANVFSVEEHIPEKISFEQSLGYAPAVGLALRSVMENESVLSI